MALTVLFKEFFNSERAGGFVLIACAFLSLLVSNIFPGYVELWHLPVGSHDVMHWINDGLMTIFFLLIGLELEREIYSGELSSFKNASLPVIAALGGMIVPAVIYTSLNSAETARGFGIPMATDIAFAIGILSLLGNRVPAALKIFLTALAVIDDLGAIVVIAAFYNNAVSFISLGICAAILLVLFVMNRLKVHSLWPYLVGGILLWYFMLNSGVHATLAGVLLAFVIPFGKGDEHSPSYKLQHFLHKPVAFLILPLFALANTAVLFPEHFSLTGTVVTGIFFGLVIGKPLGIFLFSFLSVKFKISTLSEDLSWTQILGAGMLGGIGFTMSIFITMLAFPGSELIDEAKIAIIIASVFAGVLGFIFLKKVLKNV